MKSIEYDRNKAVNYAKKWAYKRNPNYYNYDDIGGDCTNFISQCIFSGSEVMNYTKDVGWYYLNSNNKAPAWTGVESLYNFLMNNKGVGPYGKIVNKYMIMLGDVIQFKLDKKYFSHSALVVNLEKMENDINIFISTHTYDVFNKSIYDYNFKDIRYIHIENIKK